MLLSNGFLGISVRTWDCLSFIVFFGLAYLLIRPVGFDYVVMLAFPAFLLGGISHSPMYLLLVMLIKFRDSKYAPLLLFPLVLVREISVWVGTIALVLYSKKSISRSISCGLAAVIVYLFVHYVVVGDVSVDPSQPMLGMITLGALPYALVFQTESVIVQSVITIAAVACTVRSKRDIRDILLMMAPAFVMTVIWEPHVWMPVLLVLIAMRSKRYRGDALCL
jgi:hypothetical protein